MGEQKIPIAVGILPLVVGAAFVVIAIARPAFIWNLGKVRAGREWMGDTGVTAFLIVVGLALIGAGVAVVLRR